MYFIKKLYVRKYINYNYINYTKKRVKNIASDIHVISIFTKVLL